MFDIKEPFFPQRKGNWMAFLLCVIHACQAVRVTLKQSQITAWPLICSARDALWYYSESKRRQLPKDKKLPVKQLIAILNAMSCICRQKQRR